MNRPYKEFKDKWLWKKIDYDNAFWYQCVDLIKLYADKCLGMWKIWAIGNAKDVPDWKFWKKFTKIMWTDNLMQWDIIVKTDSKYWHIAIVDRILWDKVYVLEQNGSGKNSGSGTWANAIRVHAYNKSFYQVVLRNTIIIDNYEKEVEYVDVMIKEREQLLKDTKEYKNSLIYKK